VNDDDEIQMWHETGAVTDCDLCKLMRGEITEEEYDVLQRPAQTDG
jgi:hypothetical protein